MHASRVGTTGPVTNAAPLPPSQHSTAQPPPQPQPASSALQQQQQQDQHLPSTYRRLVAHGCGRSFREVATIDTLPLPAPGPKEVLVRMRYAGINGGCETFRARGEFAFAGNRQLPGGFPLGAEGCGEVVALGSDVSTLVLGQAVAVMGCASFSEYCVAAATSCTPLTGPPSAEAVALVLSAVTAAVALEATAKLQPGESVAVTAAAGGTGHFAVQLSLAHGASRVVAVAGGAEKISALEALDPRVRGVDRLSLDFESQLAAAAPTGGFDVVYEGVGGAMQQAMLRHLAPSGRLLQVGYISEYPHTEDYPQLAQPAPPGTAAAAAAAAVQHPEQQPPKAQPSEGVGASGQAQLPPNSQLFWKGLTIDRDDQRIFGRVWPSDPKAVARCRRKVFQLYDEGKLKVWIDQSQRFKGVERIVDAIDHMLKGGHIGKVVAEL